MTAKSISVVPQTPNRVKRTDYISTSNDAARSILRDLGKSPDRDPNYVPPIPLVERREPEYRGNGRPERASYSRIALAPEQLTAVTNGIVEALLTELTDAIYERFEGNLANLVERNAELLANDVACPTCSHDGCLHVHPSEEMTGADVEAYLGCTRSTRHTWLHKGEMPPPISSTTPYRWNPHVIACFKHDKRLIFESGQYDRSEHLRLFPLAVAEHEQRRQATSAKLSAHMVRRNAMDRRSKTRSTGTKRGAK